MNAVIQFVVNDEKHTVYEVSASDPLLKGVNIKEFSDRNVQSIKEIQSQVHRREALTNEIWKLFSSSDPSESLLGYLERKRFNEVKFEHLSLAKPISHTKKKGSKAKGNKKNSNKKNGLKRN